MVMVELSIWKGKLVLRTKTTDLKIMAEELSSISGCEPEATLPFDPRNLVDCLEAWIPEPIAVVKLRGFMDEIGGEVVNSDPGLIFFLIENPRTEKPPPPGLFA